MNKRLQDFSKTLGPGVLLALSATGTSHLVQSTRAGAGFGISLLVFILLANLFKYPFIEYGSRYASATGKSILEGYFAKGKWAMYIYLLVNLATMFTVNGGVTFVTAGLLSNMIGWELSIQHTAALIFFTSFSILAIGRYRLLDSLLKIVGSVLVITTLAAFFIALKNGPQEVSPNFVTPSLFSGTSLFFIIALMGWMPTAIELSPWNSLWTLERIKQTGFKPSLKQSLVEFNFGYWSSAFIAVLFMGLGALLIYGTDKNLSDSSAGFAQDLIAIFTASLGNWSYWIIVTAAFCTMFSTSITVLDGFSRSSQAALELLLPQHSFFKKHSAYIFMMLLVSSGAYLLISTFVGSFSAMIDFATTVSFLAAPVMAILNFSVINSSSFPISAKPKSWMQWLSYMGIFFLIVFSVLFIVLKISPISFFS